MTDFFDQVDEAAAMADDAPAQLDYAPAVLELLALDAAAAAGLDVRGPVRVSGEAVSQGTRADGPAVRQG